MKCGEFRGKRPLWSPGVRQQGCPLVPSAFSLVGKHFDASSAALPDVSSAVFNIQSSCAVQTAKPLRLRWVVLSYRNKINLRHLQYLSRGLRPWSSSFPFTLMITSYLYSADLPLLCVCVCVRFLQCLQALKSESRSSGHFGQNGPEEEEECLPVSVCRKRKCYSKIREGMMRISGVSRQIKKWILD